VGFVVAGQAAVVHEPAEGAFDDPAAGLDVESADGGVALDDFEVDADLGGVFDGFGLVAVVGPGFGDSGVALADLAEEVGAGGGVVDAGGGDGDGEQEAEGVGDDVPLASDDLLGRVDALAGQVDGGGGFDALAVDQAGAGFAGAAFCLADFAAEQAGELVEDAFGFPVGEVAVDALVGREVVGQVAPGDAGAVDRRGWRS
jgi:hypothetical protein